MYERPVRDVLCKRRGHRMIMTITTTTKRGL